MDAFIPTTTIYNGTPDYLLGTFQGAPVLVKASSIGGGAGGVSLPTGGTTGQYLKKNSATDGDATWVSFAQTQLDLAALQGTLAQGDVFYYNGSNIVRLAAGSSGNFLKTQGAGANPVWAAIPGGGDALTGNPLSQFAPTTSAQLLGVISDETGSGSLVFANTPTLVTPNLGTPNSGTLTSCTGLPISTGVSGLASNVATFLGNPSSTNFRAMVTDETGTGQVVCAGSPTITAPTISGLTTYDGAVVQQAHAMAGLAVDVTQGLNTKTVSADSTFTFSTTPTQDTVFSMLVTNSDTAGHVMTIPSSKSLGLGGATISSFWLPAGGMAWLTWRYDGTNYELSGDLPAFNNFAGTVDPTATDDILKGYAVGSVFYNTTGKTAWQAVDVTASNAVWLRTLHRGTFTWANRPTTAQDGETCFISDVGIKGSTLWRYHGTDARWYPTADITLKDTNGYVSGTNTASEQVIANYQFPAGLTWDNCVIQAEIRYGKASGTTDASTHIGFRAGTLGTTGDTSLLTPFDGTTKIQAAAGESGSTILWKRNSATSIERDGQSGQANNSYAGGNTSSSGSAITVPTMNSAFYLNFVVQMAGATDTPRGALRLRLRAPG